MYIYIYTLTKDSCFNKIFPYNETRPYRRPSSGRPRLNPNPVSSPTPASPIVTKTNLPLKKKLHYVSKQLVEFTCSDGRQPMLLFMEKPSKKLYPEYYNVIERPIDMLTIEANIKVYFHSISLSLSFPLSFSIYVVTI